MVEQLKGASLNPDTFVAGGLPDDIDIIIKKFRYVDDFDYNGAIQQPILAAKLDYVTRDGEEGTQHYSAGDLKRLIPSTDGKRAVPVAGKDSAVIIQSSNLAQLVLSLCNAGYPKDKLTDDISQFEGMGVHVRRVAQTKKAGLKQEEGKKEQQVMVVSEILWFPGEAPKFTVGSGGKHPKTVGAPAGIPGNATTAPAAPAASDPAVDTKTSEYIIQLLTQSGGTVARSTIPASLFAICKSDPLSSKILTNAYTQSWLSAPGRPFKYDPATDAISIG
jgi:hypothetical protein